MDIIPGDWKVMNKPTIFLTIGLITVILLALTAVKTFGALPELTQKYLWIAPNGTQYTCDIDLNGTFIGCSPNLVIRTNSSIDGKKELDDFLKNIIPKLDFIPLQGA